MRHETQDALLASIGMLFGLLAVVAWDVIDPLEVEAGLLVSLMVIAIELQSSGSL
jgi:hypothetical protein